MTNAITFRKADQATLFDLEIVGQLSDGYWENTNPMGHWKLWCTAEVKVGKNVGRNFYPRKDNYDLLNKDLLTCVAQRMINYVKLARRFSRAEIYILDHFLDIDGEFRGAPVHTGSYWDSIRSQLAQYDGEEIKRIVEDNSYTVKELRQDLREMKKTFRTVSV